MNTSIGSTLYTFRAATTADLPALKFVDPLLRADPDRAGIVHSAVQAGGCLVAQDSDGVLGYLLNGDLLGHRFISLLVVAVGSRRQGVGQALLDEACRRCDRPKLFISCNRSNIAAQCLFEKCGFERSGQIYNLDEEDPELVYYKKVVAQSAPRFENLKP